MVALAYVRPRLAGGGREGNFFNTAILTDIDKDNEAYGEEFFGPVASVFKVGSEEAQQRRSRWMIRRSLPLEFVPGHRRNSLR